MNLSENPASWKEQCGGFDAAVMCASITSLMACKTAPAETARINVTAMVELSKYLADCGAFIAFLSTSLVLDGSTPAPLPDTPACPQTEYGRQKSTAECELKSAVGKSLAVVRLTKVLDPSNSLVRGWQDELRARRTIHPFSDMPLAPVSLDHAVDMLIQVIEQRLTGTIHVSASHDITYKQAAEHLARLWGAPEDLICAVPSRERFPDVEHVPCYSALGIGQPEAAWRMFCPDPYETLSAVFA